MRNLSFALLLATVCLGSTAAAKDDFNPYIMRSIEKIVSKRGGLGYDLHGSFSKNLAYGGDRIDANSLKPKTMCVAGVAEVLVEAINLYASDHGNDVYKMLPKSAWSSGRLTDLRASIWMYEGSGSNGTAWAFKRFQLGEELKFDVLKAGDVINLNRDGGSGHAVIFLAYLDKNNKETARFTNDVRGFKYFSSQGKGKPDAGFGYRYGFFSGYCPSEGSINGVVRDCKIIRSNSSRLLNVGRMWSPSEWRYEDAKKQIKDGVRSGFQAANPGKSKGFIDNLTNAALAKELVPDPNVEAKWTGVDGGPD